MPAFLQTTLSNAFFLNENVRISINISVKIVPLGSNKQYSSIGSDNGLASTRSQAFIWTSDG